MTPADEVARLLPMLMPCARTHTGWHEYVQSNPRGCNPLDNFTRAQQQSKAIENRPRIEGDLGRKYAIDAMADGPAPVISYEAHRGE